MPADADAPRGRRSLDTDRLAGFSDGVFSIAATLLVLDLAVHPPGTPLDQVLHAWPGYLGYLVSFLTIGGAWLLHTAMTNRLTRADPNFLCLNLLFLLVVAFLPFPTRLVTEALRTDEGETVAATVYGLTLLALRLMAAAVDAYARREPRGHGRDDAQQAHRKLLPVVVGYVIAILIGLVLPQAAVALYFGIAVYLVVPFREIARLLFRRS